MPDDPRLTLLLALADDELVIGHRHSEWTGWAPHLEEDLAFSSIAQDEIAHARTLYEIVASIDGRDLDALALGREPGDYRNAVLCERTNGDFAYTVARHWLYDHADDERLAALEATTFKELAEAVRVLRLEERYHLEHADAWFRRLAEGPVDARHRFAEALAQAYPDAVTLFEPLESEPALLADGTLPRSNEELLAAWSARVAERLASVGLERVVESGVEARAGEMIPTSTGELPDDAAPIAAPRAPVGGGRRGVHSEEFTALWEEMTGLYRAHPGARW